VDGGEDKEEEEQEEGWEISWEVGWVAASSSVPVCTLPSAPPALNPGPVSSLPTACAAPSTL